MESLQAKTSVGARIKELMFRLGKNQSSFGDSIGYSQTSIRNTITESTKPGFEMLAKILKTYPNVNEKWLVQGEGEMFNTKVKSEENTKAESTVQTNNDGGTMLQLLKDQYEKRIAELSNALQDARYTIGLQKKILEAGNFNDPITGKTGVIVPMWSEEELALQNQKLALG